MRARVLVRYNNKYPHLSTHWRCKVVRARPGTIAALEEVEEDVELKPRPELGVAFEGEAELFISLSAREVLPPELGLARGLVLEYPMHEGGGDTVHDASGRGNHGTIYGATWEALPSGKPYLRFSWDDQRVECPPCFTAEKVYSFTVVAVFNVFEVKGADTQVYEHLYGGYETIALQGMSSDYPKRLRYFVRNLVEGLEWHEVEVEEEVVGKWLFSAHTFSRGRSRIYLQGELVDEARLGVSYVDAVDDKGNKLYFALGYDADYPERLEGGIAYFAVFERELDEGEVRAIYEVLRRAVPELG